MKCLRSGYCCIQYSEGTLGSLEPSDEVIILVDPDLGLIESNMEAKHTGVHCRHLVGTKPGSFSCAIHEHPIYKQTPCYAYGQVEVRNTNCRAGEYLLKPENQELARKILVNAKNFIKGKS